MKEFQRNINAVESNTDLGSNIYIIYFKVIIIVITLTKEVHVHVHVIVI